MEERRCSEFQSIGQYAYNELDNPDCNAVQHEINAISEIMYIVSNDVIENTIFMLFLPFCVAHLSHFLANPPYVLL
jgi:hypothetical protein